MNEAEMPEPLGHLEYEVMMWDGYFVIEERSSWTDYVMPPFDSDGWLLTTENQVTIAGTSQGLAPWEVRLESWDSEPPASAQAWNRTSESLAYFATGCLVAWTARGESAAGEFDLSGKGVYRVRASAGDQRFLVQFWPGADTDSRDEVPPPGRRIDPVLLSLNIPDEVKSVLIDRSTDGDGNPRELTEQDIREAYATEHRPQRKNTDATTPPDGTGDDHQQTAG
ncbi:hypothetical protein [Amycolatopsis sp. WGS_07]|uniref:hypothetical protein n=1 Tax=Amycolatopsis sp. WGS_07 TaxID=3076764 RepID=UPI003872F6AC